MATRPSVDDISGVSSSGAASVTTPAQSVTSGSIGYVQIAMYGSGLTNPSVSDSQDGLYELLASGHNSSIFLWVFRRYSPLASSSSFEVTVTPSSSSAPIEVVSIAVLNDGGVDAVSTFQHGTGTTESSSVASSVTNDLVLFLGADHSATFSSWGSGQTGLTTYPTPPPNVTAWGSYQSQASPGTASSSRIITASLNWAAISIAISPMVPWSGVSGRPYLTVSPIGLLTTPAAAIANNGADFGPDTDGTMTNGIQEALNAIGGASGPAPSVGSCQGNSSNSATSVSTPATQTVTPGSGIYVQVVMHGTSLATPTISDNQNGSYNILLGGNNGSVYLWVYRRTTAPGASTTFQVTATTTSSAAPMEVVCIEVTNDGGIDAESSAIQTGTGTSETSSLTANFSTDVVLMLGADNSATFSAWGTGQTGISTYPTPPTSVTAWGSQQAGAAASTVNSSRTVTASATWIAMSLAIRPSATGGTVYCKAGTYLLKAPIGNTGNYQEVIFEPGCTVTGSAADLNPGGATLEALVWVAQDPSTATWTSIHAYHHVMWLGNGCQVNMADPSTGVAIIVANLFEHTVNGPLTSPSSLTIGQYGPPAVTDQAHHVVVDNFEVYNLSGNAIWFQTNNTNTSGTSAPHPTISQQARQWRVSNIYAHSWFPTSPSLDGRIVGISSVRLFTLDHIYLDLRSLPSQSNGWAGLFVFSARGDTAGIKVLNSVVVLSSQSYTGSGGTEEILELQGSGQASNYGGQSTYRVLLDNCVFMIENESGYPTFPIGSAGNVQGGAFIDDSNGASNGSVISDFEFRNCEFINVGIVLEENASGIQYFGYARFSNCRFEFPSNPLPGGDTFYGGIAGGNLSGRGPFALSPSGRAMTVPASTTPYTNSWGFDERIIVQGGSVTEIDFNGVKTGVTQGSFFLRTGDSLTLTYSSAPAMTEFAM
jgi:hypothetical protein